MIESRANFTAVLRAVAAKAAGSARPVSVVMNALLPLMETFAKDAADRAMVHVKAVQKKVATEGLDVAFPEFRKLTMNEQWDRQLVAKRDRANARHRFAARVTGEDAEEVAQKYIEDEVYSAQQQFLAYAWKLETKVGAVTSAKLDVTYHGVWGESYLRVTTAEGANVLWKTQTIVNRSVLDNLFYQWPTRIVKG